MQCKANICAPYITAFADTHTHTKHCWLFYIRAQILILHLLLIIIALYFFHSHWNYVRTCSCHWLTTIHAKFHWVQWKMIFSLCLGIVVCMWERVSDWVSERGWVWGAFGEYFHVESFEPFFLNMSNCNALYYCYSCTWLCRCWRE